LSGPLCAVTEIYSVITHERQLAQKEQHNVTPFYVSWVPFVPVC